MDFIFRIIGYLLRIISNLLLLLVFIILIPLSKPYIKDYNSYAILKWSSTIDERVRLPIKQAIQKVIPTSIGNLDLSRLYVILLIFIVTGLIGKMGIRLNNLAFYLRQKREVEEWKSKEIGSEMGKAASKTVDTLTEKIDQLKHAKAKSRRELIKDIVSLKEQLNEMKRTLAFLSIDVVGSTAMKEQESKLDIQYDFDQYNEIVTRILEQNNCVKYTTTPDGIMAAFIQVKYAVSSAQTLLSQLKTFNEQAKKMKQSFTVRLGINSGIVIFDESEPLESLSDRVVDIAGHMQKHAEPGTIYISESSYNRLKDFKKGFIPIEKVIDGEKVYQWSLE